MERVPHLLGTNGARSEPIDPRVERTWVRDGIRGEEISWDVGFGPRTLAWLLRPDHAATELPGVLALHDHGDIKYYGKEKIADGPDAAPASISAFRERFYGGVPFANELAREGFAVLVPDVFMWGSRKFDAMSVANVGYRAEAAAPTDAATYDRAARSHEEQVAKYCMLLGISISELVAREDRLAALYLASRPDVKSDGIGCIGLSAGGFRAGLLLGRCEEIRAAVVVGMMSTLEALFDEHISRHSWLICLPGASLANDWPRMVGGRAPARLLVQYLLDDHLFPVAGMRAANDLLTVTYADSGVPSAYVAEFYPGPHRFDLEMQRSAFLALNRWLPASDARDE
ncbi:dienelactone hydrolase family protein [Micromonospora taraxaci]|uniref:dienelactone hydrolase family protein n=1 Tax=Micromonospora taraxaci TaxID=1316803 RepID=UPI00142EF01C|nr:dienelactone hydrolase family protein [Micromonospora taraxaci]